MLHHVEQAVLVLIDRLTSDSYAPTSGQLVVEAAEAAGLSLDEETLTRVLLHLREGGLLTSRFALGSGASSFREIELSRTGRAEARASGGDPFERIHADAHGMVASPGFEAAYPGAFEPWSEAERLLTGQDAAKQLSTIGHKVRESTQGFATAMIEHFGADDPEKDVALVKKRLGAAIAKNRDRLGEKHRKVLEDLGELWESSVDLIQRQEHAAQKEGEQVTVQDARRVVYLTMFLMIEFVTIFEELPPPRAAVLEPAGRSR
jgi:hypothetical protein